VEARVTELRAYTDEAERLERILAVWNGPAKPAKAQRTTSTARKTNGTGTRAPRGSRSAESERGVTETVCLMATLKACARHTPRTASRQERKPFPVIWLDSNTARRLRCSNVALQHVHPTTVRTEALD
jgi:hypothetical protein